MRKVLLFVIVISLLACGAQAAGSYTLVSPETGYANFDSEGYPGSDDVMSKIDMVNNEDILVDREGALVSTTVFYDGDGNETNTTIYTLFNSEFGRMLKYDNGQYVGYGVGNVMYLEHDGQHIEGDFDYLMGNTLDTLWNGMCFFIDDAEKLCAFRKDSDDKQYILTICDELMMEYVTDSSLKISECRQYALDDSGKYVLKLICHVTYEEVPEIPSYVESFGSGT